MNQLQISLAAMFGLTAAAALAVVLYRNVGLYWILVIGCGVACWRAPTWEGSNPILQGIAYGLTVLVFACTLSYYMEIPAFQTIFPCFILPALAYIVGFTKGMESA